MAIYRTVSMSFWTDSKVIDDFTPEDKYFYLYLFTNPHTNLAGCYEISYKTVATQTGYEVSAIESLLKRFEEVYHIIKFNEDTKEILLLNWYKYNWTSSEKFQKPLIQEIESVKTADFKAYLINAFQDLYGIDTLSIPYGYGSDITDTVTVTDTVSDTVSKITPKKLRLEFEELWKLYPKKQGKDKAYGYYERARRNGATYEDVEQGINAYKAYISANQVDVQFIKQGSTFFSQKAWQDDWSIRHRDQSSNPFMEMLKTGDY